LGRLGLGWLAALAAAGLALARLDRLLTAGLRGGAWQLVLVAAALLGGVATFTTLAWGIRLRWVVVVNLVGAMLAIFRVAVPDSLAGGILPIPSSLPAMGREFAFALELIRYGAAPVVASAGLLAVLAGVFWALGALAVGGLRRGKTWWAVLPALALYLQFATLDRRPPGRGWPAAFAAVAVLALLAATPGPKGGRMRTADGRIVPRTRTSLPVSFAVLGVAAAVAGSAALAAAVPETGLVNWRNQTLFGFGIYGGWSSNLFVGLQQQLVSQSDEPVFLARVAGADSADLYWRILTLEQFDGVNWSPAELAVRRPNGRDGWESADLAFRGPTTTANQVVVIQSLRQNLLPVLYSPTDLTIENSPLLQETFRVRADGSVKIDALTTEGLTYRVSSAVPTPDYQALATRGESLSPIFARAAAAGLFPGEAQPSDTTPLPDDFASYLDLPNDFPLTLRTLARRIGSGAATPFEAGLLLEAFFTRPASGFQYSVNVDTGHTALDLADWLLDPESRNYRTGYCEQYATAMAALARAGGIASRVVLGFAPGDVESDAGGELLVVRQRHAHAWVELWMRGQGWVRFDPTPRSDGITRPAVEDLGFDPITYVPSPDQIDPNLANPLDGSGRDPFVPDTFPGDFGGALPAPGFALPGGALLVITLGLLAMVGLIPVIKAVRRRRRLRRLRSGDIAAAWEEIVDRLADLGSPVEPHLTPLENARAISPSMVPLANAFSEAAYSGQAQIGAAHLAQGVSSFAQTEAELATRHTIARRLAAAVHPSSLWSGLRKRRPGAPR
jgi:transglutaminase-like putative cysteine protease